MLTTILVFAVVGLGVAMITIPSSNPEATHGLTELLGSVYLEDLPDGLFRNLLTFFESLKSTYLGVFEVLGNGFVNVIGASPISIFIGAGLSIYIGYVCVKFVVGIVTGS